MYPARRKPIAHEHNEQVKLFRWAFSNEDIHPELKMMFAVPNGGVRGGNPRQRTINGLRLKQEGVRNGVPDIFLAVPKGIYHGLFIEMKHGKNVMSEDQVKWKDKLLSFGYDFSLCYSYEIAKTRILEYLDLEPTNLPLN